MGPSDEPPEPATWPAFLSEPGGKPRVRCLSDRHHRQVYLVEQAPGGFRVFKVLRHQSASDLDRFDAVRQRLGHEPRCPWLLPVLGHGVDRTTGLAWEELAVVDHADPGGFSLESYSPELLRTAGVGDESGLVERVAAVGLELLRAMEHLHGLGVVHGDIKPSNVFRLRSKWVLGDYDSAVLSDSALPVAASTEGYRPPGVVSGAECDTYALGKVLYELWTGNDRLEYPNLPGRLVSRTRWTRAERLLNDLVNGLCSPVGLHRIRDLGFIRETLSALGSGSESDQIRLQRSRVLKHGHRRPVGMALALLGMGVAILGTCWVRVRGGPHAVQRIGFQGVPLEATLYRHPKGENDGYLRWGGLNESPAVMLFNGHLTLREPLRTGDRLELGFRKDTWRGHVGVYLSDRPFASEHRAEIGHRERFGVLSHQLVVHVDGDQVVAPTASTRGVSMPLPAEAWNPLIQTNTLQTHWVSMTVGAGDVQWSVTSGGLEIAHGRLPRVFERPFLGVYVFDNTLCYLRWLKVEHAPADAK